jgi:hypothetical protein
MVVKELLGHENLNTTEGYLSIKEESLYEGIRKLDESGDTGVPTVERIREAETCQASVDVTVHPVGYGKGTTDARSATLFVVPLQDWNIAIDRIEVRTPDVLVPYQLLLFETDPGNDSGDWEYHDILRLDPFQGRLMAHTPPQPVPYRNADRKNIAYAALCVGQHPYRFDLSAEQLVDYSERPVIFEVRIRYHLET